MTDKIPQSQTLKQPLLPGASVVPIVPIQDRKLKKINKKTWILRLEPYFTLLKSEFNGGRTVFFMECTLCKAGSKQSDIKGKGEENFKKHLKSVSQLELSQSRLGNKN
jgi:hypothetical protein